MKIPILSFWKRCKKAFLKYERDIKAVDTYVTKTSEAHRQQNALEENLISTFNTKDTKMKQQLEGDNYFTVGAIHTVNLDRLMLEVERYCSVGKRPDYIMVHTKHRKNIEEEVYWRTMMSGGIRGKVLRIYGIRVIWTKSIGKNEVICTSKA